MSLHNGSYKTGMRCAKCNDTNNIVIYAVVEAMFWTPTETRTAGSDELRGK